MTFKLEVLLNIDKNCRFLNQSNQLTFLFISGVILFASDQEVAELMNAVKRIGATGKFSWIGSDGWSARALVSEGIFNNSISCITKAVTK